MSAESAHLSTFGAETEIWWTSSEFGITLADVTSFYYSEIVQHCYCYSLSAFTVLCPVCHMFHRGFRNGRYTEQKQKNKPFLKGLYAEYNRTLTPA